eukprot:gene4139-7449_t
MNTNNQTFYPQIQVNQPVVYTEQQQPQQQYFEQQQFLQTQNYPQNVQPQLSQPQFSQPQFIQPEPLRRLEFDTPITRTKNNIGQIDETTGNLTFTSTSWFFKIMLIITAIYFVVITAIVFLIGFSSDHFPIWMFVIPLVLFSILLLDRKYQVIFDDKNHLLIIKGGFRFLPCVPFFALNRTIRYNDIKDIYNELFYVNKSKIILITTNDEHVPLLTSKHHRASSLSVHYSQRIVEEMREHLTFVTNQ